MLDPVSTKSAIGLTSAVPPLDVPVTTQPFRLSWPDAIGIAAIHLLALLAFVPWLFSWTGVVLAFLGLYVFGTLGMLCAGQAADRLLARGAGIVASRKWPVCVGLLGGGAFTVPAAYTPSVTMAVVYICLAMFFINMASGAAWMMVSVAVPKRQVASLGSIQNFGGYFAGSFAPVITGYIVQGTGSYVNALLAAAAVAVLAAVAYIVLVRKPLEGSETLIRTERAA